MSVLRLPLIFIFILLSIYSYASNLDINTKKQEIYNFFIYKLFINPKTNQYINLESEILDSSTTPFLKKTNFIFGGIPIELDKQSDIIFFSFLLDDLNKVRVGIDSLYILKNYNIQLPIPSKGYVDFNSLKYEINYINLPVEFELFFNIDANRTILNGDKLYSINSKKLNRISNLRDKYILNYQLITYLKYNQSTFIKYDIENIELELLNNARNDLNKKEYIELIEFAGKQNEHYGKYFEAIELYLELIEIYLKNSDKDNAFKFLQRIHTLNFFQAENSEILNFDIFIIEKYEKYFNRDVSYSYQLRVMKLANRIIEINDFTNEKTINIFYDGMLDLKNHSTIQTTDLTNLEFLWMTYHILGWNYLEKKPQYLNNVNTNMSKICFNIALGSDVNILKYYYMFVYFKNYVYIDTNSYERKIFQEIATTKFLDKKFEFIDYMMIGYTYIGGMKGNKRINSNELNIDSIKWLSNQYDPILKTLYLNLLLVKEKVFTKELKSKIENLKKINPLIPLQMSLLKRQILKNEIQGDRENLTQDKTLYRNVLIGVIGVSSIIILIVFTILFYNYYHVRKIKQKLSSSLLNIHNFKGVTTSTQKVTNLVIEYKKSNDHKLKNSLNSIHSLLFSSIAYMKDLLENSKQNIIPLEQEIEIANSFFEIYKESKNGKYNLEYDENVIKKMSAQGYKIIPNVLQAFIENALKYSKVTQLGSKGIIKIECHELKRNVLQLSIIDNGKKIKESKKLDTVDDNTGVSLKEIVKLMNNTRVNLFKRVMTFDIKKDLILGDEETVCNLKIHRI